MSDWASGGYATQAAETLANFADFIRSQYGPSAPVFAQAFDAQLRGSSIEGFKGAAPTDFKEWHIGAVWAEIEKATEVDFSAFTIGKKVYLGDSTEAAAVSAAKAKWWSKDGADALRLLTQSAKGRSGGRKFTKDELQGLVLSYKECMGITNNKIWKKFQSAVDDDDLPGAQRQLSKNHKIAKQLRRAFVGIHKAESLTIPEKEAEKATVYEALADLNRMVALAIQGKIHSHFPLRKLTTLAFAESVRDSLAAVNDSAAGIGKALSLLLGCELQQLKQQQHANLLPALAAVGDILELIMGTALTGPYLGRNMSSVLNIWATVDGNFEAWPAFIEKDSPCPYSLVKSILLPRVTEWTGTLWEALRKGGKMPKAMDMTLSDFLEHRLMKQEDDDYLEMCRTAKRIKRGGVKAAAADNRSWQNQGDIEKYVKANNQQGQQIRQGQGCGYCRDVLKLPERNWIGHPETKCNVKKRKLAEQADGADGAGKRQRLDDGEVTCHFCKAKGHKKKDCPKHKAEKAKVAAAAEAKKAAAAAAKP